jgi:hypothetical protein
MKLKARCPPGSIRRVEIQPQCHSCILATARAYVVYITTPGQIVAVGLERSTGGLHTNKAMNAARPAVITRASY